MGNNPKLIAFRKITAAEFACLSSSMQLTLLTILRAQSSSRTAIAAMAERKKRHGDAKKWDMADRRGGGARCPRQACAQMFQ